MSAADKLRDDQLLWELQDRRGGDCYVITREVRDALADLIEGADECWDAVLQASEVIWPPAVHAARRLHAALERVEGALS